MFLDRQPRPRGGKHSALDLEIPVVVPTTRKSDASFSAQSGLQLTQPILRCLPCFTPYGNRLRAEHQLTRHPAMPPRMQSILQPSTQSGQRLNQVQYSADSQHFNVFAFSPTDTKR